MFEPINANSSGLHIAAHVIIHAIWGIIIILMGYGVRRSSILSMGYGLYRVLLSVCIQTDLVTLILSTFSSYKQEEAANKAAVANDCRQRKAELN